MCVCDCDSVCMSISVSMYVYVCLCALGGKRDVRYLGARDTGGYEPPDMGTRNQTHGGTESVPNH